MLPPSNRVSKDRTPWAITCHEHGLVFLTREEYNFQLDHPNAKWICPVCNRYSYWDDDNYEDALDDERRNALDEAEGSSHDQSP